MANVDRAIAIGASDPLPAEPSQAARYLVRVNAARAKEKNVAPLALAEVGEIVAGFYGVGFALGIGIDPAGALAQSILETDAYTFGNQVAKEQHNTAGIGATNDGAAGHSWPTWATGIEGQYRHLQAWARMPGGEKSIRFKEVTSAAKTKGYARTWRELGGRWAVPGVGYGDGIERHWQGILSEATTMPTIADVINFLPTGSNRQGTKLRGFHAVVIHETDNEAAGANAAMHRRWLEQSRPDASFHICADADQTIQILPLDELCWAIGDGADEPTIDESFYTVSIEICVNDRARFPQACRRAAKAAAAVLLDKGARPGPATVRQHGSYWSTRNASVHQGCPKHLKAGDWGATWIGFLAMVIEEYGKIGAVNTLTEQAPTPTTATKADASEAAALKGWAEALIPYVARGVLKREGVVDLREFDGDQYERLALYERFVAHRLAGKNYIMTLEGWDALRAAGKVVLY